MATILVIDDDSAVRRALCAILRSDGHRTVEADGGRAGVAALGQGDVALVITDLMMPDQDGIETILAIREIAPTLPIIAVSGMGDETFSPLDDARLMGADRTIGKPFDVATVRALVRELLP